MMKKLKLDVAELRVESFASDTAATATATAAGTVRGHESIVPNCIYSYYPQAGTCFPNETCEGAIGRCFPHSSGC